MRNIPLQCELLRIKTCDMRLDALLQCETAIDRGIHVGGAFSALPILTALFYGGGMSLNIENPTSAEQDVFVLSKGHAVAALASVYADLGYFDREHLAASRGWNSKIKGHPGPLIPGVPVATGPLGHGTSIAAGYALARKEAGRYNAYCLVGDGELQEGSNWEGLMYAGSEGLRNLCVMVDQNNGQSDNTADLVVSLGSLQDKLEAFGFRVLNAYHDNMASLLSALETFQTQRPDDRPTAILVHGTKGDGGYGSVMGKHKATLSDEELANERFWLARHRGLVIRGLERFAHDEVKALSSALGYEVITDESGRICTLKPCCAATRVKRAQPRNKALAYEKDKLPQLRLGQEAGTTELMTACMAVLAADERLWTIDSDLSNASGLYDGVRRKNRCHALNVGIAECNMMCIGEALASEGANVWTSTFTPFFDLRAFRRIAVSYQERQEEIEAADGWLSWGHNLDITFLGTSANLDTAVNGASHMGNDDICIYGRLAHVKVIDTSCPQQLVAVVRWIAQGNRGLVYLRTMRGKAPALYPADFEFSYGKGYALKPTERAALTIVTSGRGVGEALKTAESLEKQGVCIGVVDMPSLDMGLLTNLTAQKCPLFFAEQNNGALLEGFCRAAAEQKVAFDPKRILHANTCDEDNQPRFISSGTYEQLTRELGLDAKALEKKIMTYLHSNKES